MKLIIYILLTSIFLVNCKQSNISEKNSSKKLTVSISQKEKFKGLSFVGNPKPITDSCLNAVVDLGANSITLMPFAFLESLNDADVEFNFRNQWWGETPTGIDSCIQIAHRKSLRVCIKPQLWVGQGDFTGYINYTSENDWKNFESTYCEFLLPFLKIAEKNKIELFCIGTELAETVKNKPEMWLNIIAFCKKHFSGKLTYAENWDAFHQFPYWDKVDYIGVDAYFPLVEVKDPTSKALKKGWKKPLEQLKACSDKFNKPILFTEFGYRASDWACAKPWNHKNELQLNEKLQARAYQVLFESVWNKEWFAGGFAWKWFPFHEEHLGEDRTEYSPQGKLAEQTLKQNYRK